MDREAWVLKAPRELGFLTAMTLGACDGLR
jgi:hypothetical protein